MTMYTPDTPAFLPKWTVDNDSVSLAVLFLSRGIDLSSKYYSVLSNSIVLGKNPTSQNKCQIRSLRLGQGERRGGERRGEERRGEERREVEQMTHPSSRLSSQFTTN